MNKNIEKTIDFFNDDTLYYSASLSFFTIFSLLPILALVVVVVSNLPMFDTNLTFFTIYLMDFINPTHSTTIATTITEFLKNVNDLGNIGMFYLLFVFTLFFNNYEDIVNKIYNVKKRPIYKMFFLYLSFLILVPMLFMTFIAMSSIDVLKENISLQFTTFIFMWGLLTLIFKIFPTIKVSLNSAIIGSFITLVTLGITKKLFTIYIIYNTTYATIYGSFSVVLFFFLWIYISWTIYLYGTKFTALMNKKHNLDIIA